ncbi:hypothetical protein WA026_018525 [Henosepilachna vigintioctopunctata]|uniref:Uncharacterized protein n=1 Tax=Henosepilachna vigintioctopunctata TaxID=420089 RepID=A0AAW1UB18_9CUCU
MCFTRWVEVSLKMLVLILTICSIVSVFGREFATSRHVNIEELMSNERILKQYHLCIVKGQRCGGEPGRIRQLIPELMLHGCSNCSLEQIDEVRRFTEYLYKHKRQMLADVYMRFDPFKNYRQQWLPRLVQLGFSQQLLLL